MNIWLVNPTAGGPGLARQWRSYWFARHWQSEGHTVTVITGTYHHLMSSGPRAAGLQRLEDVHLWCCPTSTYTGNGVGRVMHMLRFGRAVARSATQIAKVQGKPDVVIYSSPPIFGARAVSRMARRLGASFWLEVRDVWPASLVELGQASRWNPLVWLAAHGERLACRSAELAISPLVNAHHHLQSKGLRGERFVWAPNGVAQADIETALNQGHEALSHPCLSAAHEARQAGRLVVLYAGAIGPPQGLDVLIDAVALLAARGVAVQLLMLGDGVSRALLEAHSAQCAGGSVRFFGEVPKTVAQAAMRACDVAVMSLVPSTLWRHGISPNKLFEYALFAPHVLATCDPTALRGLESLEVTTVEPGDAAALASALELRSTHLGLTPVPTAAQRVERLAAFHIEAVASRILSAHAALR